MSKSADTPCKLLTINQARTEDAEEEEEEQEQEEY